MTKRALITGITGQDGSYLAEFLLDLGYEVHGAVRRLALKDPAVRYDRIEHLLDRLCLHSATLESFPSIYQTLASTQFDEVYHLAAQSFVTDSFEDPFSTMNINVNGTHYVLSAIQQLHPQCRVYFAGSSEMFGKAVEMPQTERTAFHPRSPYAISKVTGYHLTQNFRESYGMFCCSGILFNHESPRRGIEFVTRKITSSVARIKHGLDDKLLLGNLEAKRDWGHAREYVQAMHLMLQQESPEDYVICTGEAHSVRDFCEIAFEHVGLDYREYVGVDPAFYRPADVEHLLGDASKAKAELGWEPRVAFEELVRTMVDADMDLVQRQLTGG